ncbi:MAG: hypothetical protein ACPL06_00050 [Candidatus Anstonellales archaeon]
MHTLEAVFSLIVLIGFSMMLTLGADAPTDYSLYQYQLANDVWRVLYLKHGVALLYDPSVATSDLEQITSETGLCIETDFYTTCGVREGVTIKKPIVLGNVQIKVGV